MLLNLDSVFLSRKYSKILQEVIGNKEEELNIILKKSKKIEIKRKNWKFLILFFTFNFLNKDN